MIQIFVVETLIPIKFVCEMFVKASWLKKKKKAFAAIRNPRKFLPQDFFALQVYRLGEQKKKKKKFERPLVTQHVNFLTSELGRI